MGDVGVHQFGNIQLGGRGGASQGSLKVTAAGLTWRTTGGGRTVEVPKKDISSLVWTKVPRGCALAVSRKQGPAINLIGFREDDLEALRDVSNKHYEQEIQERSMAVSGRNWGTAALDGSSLVFNVGNKSSFRVALPDVTQVQQGRDEVMLEFPVDDTGGDRTDALVEMSFYVPKDAEGFPGTEDAPSCKVFYDEVMRHTDAGAAVGDAVVTFEQLAVLAPRGRFDVEMYGSFLKLVGQAQDYRIQYDSIVRLFVLPKSNSPHTLVVISLDPPIRKGQTYYPHILCQFPTDDELSVELDISEEALAAKNEKCGGKLQRNLAGPMHDCFAKALRGLSAAKLTKPGQFRTADGAGYGLRCSYKADDGYLYPLERAFFYVNKPPTLLVHDDIESVEFMRQGGGVLAASAKTFDLAIRLKNDQEYLFRGIQKSEWTNLFNFIQSKRLRVDNLREAELGPGGGGRAIDLDLGEDIDQGLAAMAGSDSEDNSYDAAAGSEDLADDDDSGSSGADSDAEPAAEATPAEKKRKKKRQAEDEGGGAAASPKPKKARKEKAPKAAAPDSGGKKKRAKKDKNAPKRGMSAFMFFSNAKRDQIKADNPGIAFGEVGKKLGEAWKALVAEDKVRYEEKAAEDKQRYAEQMVAYREKQAAEGAGAAAEDDGGGNDSE